MSNMIDFLLIVSKIRTGLTPSTKTPKQAILGVTRDLDALKASAEQFRSSDRHYLVTLAEIIDNLATMALLANPTPVSAPVVPVAPPAAPVTPPVVVVPVAPVVAPAAAPAPAVATPTPAASTPAPTATVTPAAAPVATPAAK